MVQIKKLHMKEVMTSILIYKILFISFVYNTFDVYFIVTITDLRF